MIIWIFNCILNGNHKYYVAPFLSALCMNYLCILIFIFFLLLISIIFTFGSLNWTESHKFSKFNLSFQNFVNSFNKLKIYILAIKIDKFTSNRCTEVVQHISWEVSDWYSRQFDDFPRRDGSIFGGQTLCKYFTYLTKHKYNSFKNFIFKVTYTCVILYKYIIL